MKTSPPISVISSKDVKIKKITEAFSERNIQTKEDIRKWKSRLSILNPDQHHQRDKLSQQIIRAQNKYDECLNKMEEEIRIASLSKARYTFNFEEIK